MRKRPKSIVILIPVFFAFAGCQSSSIQFSPSNGGSTGQKPPSFAPAIVQCGSATAGTASSTNGLISVDTPSSDGTRLWALGASFPIVFTTNATSSDRLSWSVQDQLGTVRGSGSFAIASGAKTYTLNCTSNYAGYLSIQATLTTEGGALPVAGTRPPGIATFGILPNLATVLPTVTYAHLDQHRFGMQGFNGDASMLSDLGVKQTIDDRQLSVMEPSGANTWTPSLSDLDSFYKNNQVMRLIRLDGIPAWASPTGAAQDDTYAPSDLTYYQNYMARVGTDSAAIRQAYFPSQQYDYFQVTWEPGWADTQAHFVAMYQAVYNGLHSTDPQALVMGTTNPFASNNTYATAYWLKQYASLGLASYLDGVTTHAYYNAGTYPSHPPELQDGADAATAANALDNEMRALRAEMQADYKPGMKLFSTEVGINYDPGVSYGSSTITANELYAQAAVAARTHIIILGEGAQATYFFYGADYPGEIGYGSFFDLADANGAFGASNLSPKPEALAFAALTRVLDGTNTLGYLNGLPANVHGYSFQQLNGGEVITALWVHNNSVWPDSGGSFESAYSVPYSLTVDSAGTSGTLVVLDMMGNGSTVSYKNGIANLTLTESPIYVLSNNATVMKAQVTTPVGYTGQ